MKKTFQAFIGALVIITFYIFYVIDNLFCIFGTGTKLPFRDFMPNPRLQEGDYDISWLSRRNFYVRLFVALVIGLIIWIVWQ